MTPQRVQRVAVEAARSALYQLPAGSPPPAGIAAAPTDSDAPIAGGYRFESRRDHPDVRPQVLRIDDTHLSLTTPSGNQHLTVELGRLAAMLAWPAGRRTLYSPDGFELRIDPDLWIAGHDLPRLLDERVPRAAVVPLTVEPLAVEPGRVRPASRPQEPWKLWWLLLGMVVFVVAAGTVSARLGAHPLPGVILWGVVTARIGLHLHRTRRARGLRGLPRQS
jgi:hypothetical protein